jgi:hypothetical protein
MAVDWFCCCNQSDFSWRPIVVKNTGTRGAPKFKKAFASYRLQPKYANLLCVLAGNGNSVWVGLKAVIIQVCGNG